MRYEQPLIEGTLIRRRKRFTADVKLRSGEEITAHCANAGSMMGCCEPGSKVLISTQDDPRRRFKYQIEIIYAGRVPVGIHSGRPTSVVLEALLQGKIPEVAGYATMRRDISIPRNSHVDVVLSGNGLRSCHLAIKSVTMASEHIAYFPDATYPGGQVEMNELTDLVREGCRAVIFFLIQRCDVDIFRPAEHIDAEFSQVFRDAIARGVEIICYRAKVTRKGIELDKKINIELGN